MTIEPLPQPICKHLFDLGQGKKFPKNPKHGICCELQQKYGSSAPIYEFQLIACSWPKHSGNFICPIPATQPQIIRLNPDQKEAAVVEFARSTEAQMWLRGPYAQLRKELCLFAASFSLHLGEQQP